MARETVNEGSTSYHAISFFDKDGGSVNPEQLRYRLMGDQGEVIIDWTSVSAGTVEIEISPAANTIAIVGGKKRYLTVEATHNGGDKITSELSYTLVDLKGISPSG